MYPDVEPKEPEHRHDTASPQEDVTSRQQPSLLERFLRGLWGELTGTLLPAVIIALVIHLFLAQATRVYGQSMEPTLHTNERVIVEKISYRFRSPQRGEIVVVRLDQRSQPLIKRVVGLPGEVIAIHDGQVYINDRPLEEDYLQRPTHGYLSPTRIPPMHYFIMGDNRGASNDSRSFGPVSRDQIIGRAFLRYWPPESIGFVH